MLCDTMTTPLVKICGLMLNSRVAEVMSLLPGWAFVAKHMFRKYGEAAIVVLPNGDDMRQASSVLRQVYGSHVRIEAVPYTLQDLGQYRRKMTNVLSVQLFTSAGMAVDCVREATAREVLEHVRRFYPEVQCAKVPSARKRCRFRNIIFVEMSNARAAELAAGGNATGKPPLLDGLQLRCGLVAHALQVDETPFEARAGTLVTIAKDPCDSTCSSVGPQSESETDTAPSTPTFFRHNPYSFDTCRIPAGRT